MQFTHKHDVFNLPRKITPEEVSRLVGDNHDVFGLFVVTEAVTGVPFGISAWLRSPEIAPEWLESLILNEGRHQIAWWMRLLTLGEGHESTQACERDLKLIRVRLSEADRIAKGFVNPQRTGKLESRALQQLKLAHGEEHQKTLDELFESSGIAHEKSTAPKRLLNMSDAAFRDLVAADVISYTEVHGLSHIAVMDRWRHALVELGTIAFRHLGLPVDDYVIRGGHGQMPFAVADRSLPSEPKQKEQEDWAHKLLFLAHVRARITERRLARLAYSQRLSLEVYGPAEERLRNNHFAEYVAYRTVAGEPPPSPGELPKSPTPQRWGEYRRQLVELGWKPRVLKNDNRAWLVARRDRSLISITAKRGSLGRGITGWKHQSFYFVDPWGQVWKTHDFELLLAWSGEPSERTAAALANSQQPILDPQKMAIFPPVDAEEITEGD